MEGRLEFREVGDLELRVDALEAAHGIGLEFGESQFVEAFFGNQRALLMVGVHHPAVALQDFLIQFRAVWLLQVGEPHCSAPVVAGGEKDLVGVAVDIDETCIWEPVHQVADARGVAGGLE